MTLWSTSPPHNSAPDPISDHGRRKPFRNPTTHWQASTESTQKTTTITTPSSAPTADPIPHQNHTFYPPHPTIPMAPNALQATQPHLHPRHRPRLRPQPRLLQLLLQGRHRLLLERCSKGPAIGGPALHRLLLHSLDHETRLGSPDRRLPRHGLPAEALLCGRRRYWDGLSCGCGD